MPGSSEAADVKFPAAAVPTRSRITLVFLILCINLPLTVYRWLPGHSFYLILVPSLETSVLLLLMYSAVQAGIRRRWKIILPLALYGTICGIYGIGETVNQYVYQRQFEPWTDLPFLPTVLRMVFESDTAGSGRTIFLGSMVVFAVLMSLLATLLHLCANMVSSLPPRKGTWLLLLMLPLLIPGMGTASSLSLGILRNLRPPPPPSIEEIFAVAPSPSTTGMISENQPYAFPYLEDRDVYLFIFESYGHTLLSREDHYRVMEPVFHDTEEKLKSSGYHIFSTLVESPITGGRSWLADATFLTGVRVETQEIFDALIETNMYNMTHMFGDGGYRSIMSAPGTFRATEEWKKFYRFDKYIFHDDFEYNGPYFCFGAMPDQYQLNRLRHDISKDPDAQPSFLMSILVSSHTPFANIPEYLDDWDRIGDGSEYFRTDNAFHPNTWLHGGAYPVGYTASVSYVLRVLTDFFDRYIERPSLIIIAGDHQPRFPVREQDASMSVLLHVLSREREQVVPFGLYGFSEGLVPAENHKPLEMERFFMLFTEVISGTWLTRDRLSGL